MTTQEMRELDAWLYDNIPGLPSNGSPTRNKADSMEVLEKCCRFLKPLNDCVSICEQLDGGSRITNSNTIRARLHAEAPTLPLAIALFAKALFSK